jgi:hypothetical protein
MEVSDHYNAHLSRLLEKSEVATLRSHQPIRLKHLACLGWEAEDLRPNCQIKCHGPLNEPEAVRAPLNLSTCGAHPSSGISKAV